MVKRADSKRVETRCINSSWTLRNDNTCCVGVAHLVVQTRKHLLRFLADCIRARILCFKTYPHLSCLWNKFEQTFGDESGEWEALWWNPCHTGHVLPQFKQRQISRKASAEVRWVPVGDVKQYRLCFFPNKNHLSAYLQQRSQFSWHGANTTKTFWVKSADRHKVKLIPHSRCHLTDLPPGKMSKLSPVLHPTQEVCCRRQWKLSSLQRRQILHS